ncbi:MAG TPA: hypothetical protein VHW02_05585 [Rhizomicrobium sp.]|jgi:filamentous hemagglutinin|nr:hypothetical protein [Rhizomicrobium sp.]
MKKLIWLAAVFIALSIAARSGLLNDFVPADTPASQSQGAVWSSGGVGAEQNAEHHWQKHGNEFPEFHNATEYESGALAFVRNPPPGTLTKHRSNGDTLFYNPQSNTFAVSARNGVPRTFFRPDNGMNYWNRQ